MEDPLRTSTATLATDRNSKAFSYGKSTKYLDTNQEIMIENVEMREDCSSSFVALDMQESEEPSSLRQEKSSPLISLD
jgi:hypothetical protein